MILRILLQIAITLVLSSVTTNEAYNYDTSRSLQSVTAMQARNAAKGVWGSLHFSGTLDIFERHIC